MDALTQLKESLSERYEIEREIGAGGMATVYLARDAGTEMLVLLDASFAHD
jgi:serine/threonine protein kinase